MEAKGSSFRFSFIPSQVIIKPTYLQMAAFHEIVKVNEFHLIRRSPIISNTSNSLLFSTSTIYFRGVGGEFDKHTELKC